METREPPGTTWFPAWVSEPWRTAQYRGIRTADLGIFPGGFVVRARSLKRLARLLPPLHTFSSAIYTWPTVIIERLKPTFAQLILFDVDGHLAAVAVGYSKQRDVREALTRAGLHVVETSLWGWDWPYPISRHILGNRVDEVPPSVVAE